MTSSYLQEIYKRDFPNGDDTVKILITMCEEIEVFESYYLTTSKTKTYLSLHDLHFAFLSMIDNYKLSLKKGKNNKVMGTALFYKKVQDVVEKNKVEPFEKYVLDDGQENLKPIKIKLLKRLNIFVKNFEETKED